MGYSFRLCVTPTKSKQTPFFPPPNYNPADFVLLSRYVNSLVESGLNPNGPTLGDIVDIFNYRNYPPDDKFDLCDGGAAFTSDAINLNIGYVEGSTAERAQIYQNTYYYVLGLVWFLATDQSVPPYTRNHTLSYGLCSDQWVLPSPPLSLPPLLLMLVLITKNSHLRSTFHHNCTCVRACASLEIMCSRRLMSLGGFIERTPLQLVCSFLSLLSFILHFPLVSPSSPSPLSPHHLLSLSPLPLLLLSLSSPFPLIYVFFFFSFLGSWEFDIHVVSRTAVQNKTGLWVANNEGNLWKGMKEDKQNKIK